MRFEIGLDSSSAQKTRRVCHHNLMTCRRSCLAPTFLVLATFGEGLAHSPSSVFRRFFASLLRSLLHIYSSRTALISTRAPEASLYSTTARQTGTMLTTSNHDLVLSPSAQRTRHIFPFLAFFKGFIPAKAPRNPSTHEPHHPWKFVARHRSCCRS
ncbi:hypothetical protein B0H14DRAFT_2978368, partial [Mycena olivaceomarginata]